MLPHYFRTAGRRLSKDKLYSFVNTIGLTIGISACLLIWMMAHYELSFDRFHPDRDRIYRAVSRRIFPGMSDWITLGNISFAAAHTIQKSYPGLDQMASFYSYNVSVTVPVAAAHKTPVKFRADEKWDMVVAESAWFSIFHYKWLAGSAASPFILWLVFRAFPEFIPPGLVYTEWWSPASLLFLAGTAIITLLLAGLYPAFVLSGLAPALSLKGRITESASRLPHLRQSLTVFQFGIALFFIIATLIVGSQLRYMLHKDLGFRQENIVNINLWGLNPNLYSDADRVRLANKIRQIAGVEEISLNRFAAAGAGDRSYRIKDLTSGAELALAAREGDENYVSMYGLKIMAGRNILVPKVDTETEILLSEKAAIELGYARPEDAIGHNMIAGWKTGPVVGILADFYTESLQQPLKPVFIFASKTDPKNLSIRLTATDGSGRANQGTLAALQKAFKEVFPTEDYNYTLFKDEIAGQYTEERQTSTIINVAMGIMILLSCMGLFGLAAFTAGRRTKEIGIRKVLGATIPGIVALLPRQFLSLVVIAFLITTPIAWYFLHKWLLDYANRITIRWWEFGLAGFGAIAVALLTVGYHSVRAALVNPVDSLHSE